MTTRRRFLTLLTSTSATAGLAGCMGGSSGGGSATNDDSNQAGNDTESEGNSSNPDPADNGSDPSDNGEGQSQDQVSQREQNIRDGIPLNGLGAYTDQMLEAGPVQEAEAEQIKQALEGTENLEQERNSLAQTLTPENYALLMSEYHRQKGVNKDTENQVVVNQNWSFTSDSEPILELYKVENGNLQSQPVIVDANQTNQRKINKPGTGEPQYLAGIRDSTNWGRLVPQDWKAIEKLRNNYEDWSEDEKRSRRESTQKRWSNGLFGIGTEDNIIPYDAESSISLFEGMYQNEDSQIVVDLNNEYRDSELFKSNNLVSAEYTGDGWKFREHPEKEIGDPLPGEDDFFKLTD